MSSVGQKTGFSLDQGTQIRLDWSYADNDPTPLGSRSFSAQQGFASVAIYDASQNLVLSRVMQTEKNAFALVDLAAGAYTLSFTSFGAVTQATAGDKALAWQASASIRAVPEASTWALMGLGLAAVATVARRRSVSARA
jgi:hypothetical protein